MNWNPAAKLITDLTPVFVRQSLKLAEPELACPNPISFTFEDLCLSLARTTSHQSAIQHWSVEKRLEWLRVKGFHLAAHLNLFVNAADEEFLFTNEIDIEADEQRTSLAAQVGTAVADLIMQRMGFYWSANARELKLRRTGKQKSRKIPDFVYDPAEGHGFPPGSIVVVEAKGSLSKQRAKRGPIRRLARDAYNEQVRHMIGARSKGLVVASGYAIAFGTVPGASSSTLALASPQRIRADAPSPVPVRSLSAAASYQQQVAPQVTEQARQMHKELMHQELSGREGGFGKPPGDGGRREGERRSPRGRIAYANYESVFLVCGAMNAAHVLRTILLGQSMETLDAERLVQDFWIVEHNGMRFWVGEGESGGWRRGLFAIYEPSGKTILRSVSEHRDTIPETLPLTVAPITARAESDEDSDITIQGDGLAMCNVSSLYNLMRWDLRAGDWS
ncbi:hypothetical protein [Mesorhizobium sp. STM 4661]|uniref:hypothetical protein n=1 Tax=Mesorhizobium sp. STM 4661 TaxID=1297570 RepID=UPI0002BDBB17|nr:hypothetical protein [Mesorhizobium sp. STM 4661]CCV11611.1 conserved hypothetical protein [Mesorhizobium sp. STM 4661]